MKRSTPYRIERNKKPIIEEVLRLYTNAGWVAYTNKPDVLMLAISQSLDVYTARYNGELVGLIRLVGDGQTIIYIQDILVHTDYKRQGIGTELMKAALAPYNHVRQKVLITDKAEESLSFYKAIGFTDVESLGIKAFIKIDNGN